MSPRMSEILRRAIGELRWEPIEKRMRARLGGATVFDTTGAVLVWEPRRVVPSFAVPEADIRAEVVPAEPVPDKRAPVLHPGIPFAVHSADGEAVRLRVDGAEREVDGFRPAEPELAGLVVVDFEGFDEWYEEDERLFAHAHDPFHRIDILRSTRPVRVELDGEVLAESDHAWLLFETNLPTRFYLPRRSVRADVTPSPRRTWCAYKGQASYWSFDVGGTARKNIAWTYDEPLREAAPIKGYVAFYDELVDVILDGERRERPTTVFSKAMLEESELADQPRS